MKSYKFKLISASDEKQIFIDFARKLYSQNEITQNDIELRQILDKTHILSKYFTIYPFLIFFNGKPVCRAILTFYENNENAYLGYFESINNLKHSKQFFDCIDKYCKSRGKKKIIGPLNCSFWLGYRMKVSNFDKRPYFGEIYNKEYYQDLWVKNGYIPTDEYITNVYDKAKPFVYNNYKSKKRFKKFQNRGYRITSLKKKDWDTHISQIYSLLIDLYSKFPEFTFIKEEDYLIHYEYLREIIDYSMLKIAYSKNEVVGFLLIFPNYNNYFNQNKKINMFKILCKKLRSSSYVALYLGVGKSHLGLGLAMAQKTLNQLKWRRAKVIGAYIKKHNFTENYMKDKIIDKYEYLMFSKDLGASNLSLI